MTSPIRRVRDTRKLAQLVAAPTDDTASITTGTVTVTASGAVTLIVGGLVQTSVLWLAEPPTNGDNVLVLRQGGTSIVLGPITGSPRPIVGTVSAIPVGSTQVSVTILTGTVLADFVASYTPTVNDSVYLAWFGNTPVIVGKVGATAGAGGGGSTGGGGGSVPPPPSGGSTGASTFPAVAVGTYRTTDGWRHDANGDVIQGDAPGVSGDNSGVWFYGGRIAASLAGVTVTDASIWLGRTNGGTFAAQNMNLQRCTNDTQPSGAPTFSGTVTHESVAVGQTGLFAVPAATVQALVDSGGSLGIAGTSSDPYMRMFGLSKSGQAGTLTINWSR